MKTHHMQRDIPRRLQGRQGLPWALGGSIRGQWFLQVVPDSVPLDVSYMPIPKKSEQVQVVPDRELG